MDINEIASKNPISLDEAIIVVGSGDTRQRCRLAANASCPQVILMSLLVDRNIDVRCAIATNPNACKVVIERLAEDQSLTVRFWLASRPNLDHDLLVKLMDDDNAYVAERARASYESILLEQELAQIKDDFSEPLTAPRLGELLLQANLIDEKLRDKMLDEALKNGIPLGRLIVARRYLPRVVVLEALRAQSWVRNGSCAVGAALEHMRRAARMATRNIFHGLCA